MTVPSDLSIISQNVLMKLSFDLTESSNNGMSKYYLWTNKEMQFSFIYDRCYYDCDIVAHKKPINPMNLIRLLRFLKSDKIFYKKKLIDANLSYTLTVNGYVELFYKNYNLIEEFLIMFNQEKYDNYNNFEFSYEGI